MDKIKILVDDREDDKAINALKEREELEVTVKRLEIGDAYCEEKGIIIERKSIEDFYQSIKGHLQSQCLNMMDNFPNRYIIIIGDEKKLRNGFIQVPYAAMLNQIDGAIVSFVTKYKTPVFRVENNGQYAKYVEMICSKEGEPIGHELIKRQTSDKDRYLYALMDSVELMGFKKATAISERFKSFTEIKNASDEELLEIDGIGQGILKNIRNSQIFW